MKMYRNGDRCPCCGQPIEGKDDKWLEEFSQLVFEYGLPPFRENSVGDNKSDSLEAEWQRNFMQRMATCKSSEDVFRWRQVLLSDFNLPDPESGFTVVLKHILWMCPETGEREDDISLIYFDGADWRFACTGTPKVDWWKAIAWKYLEPCPI